MPGNRTSVFNRVRIVALDDEGLSSHPLAESLGIPRASVIRIVRLNQEINSVDWRSGTGHELAVLGTFVSNTENEKHGGKLVPFSEEDNKEFMRYFPIIVDDLTKQQCLKDIEEITERFAVCLESIVPNGKRVRGLTTVITYKLLENPENLTTENIRLANILGWCTELVGAAFLVYDDVMDNSLTRRNNPCWHRRDGVGLVAISDAIGLNTSAYLILKKYFSTHPKYIKIFEFFHSVTFHTAFGQTMDTKRYAPKDINMQKYKTIAKYKTGFYTFYYPVILGMYLSNKYDRELLDNKIAPLLFDMGEFFQIKNDYNDCFAKLDVTGKSGTDIEESKCTWLAVKALEKCSPSQRKLFEENYGKAEKTAIKTIRNLYVELGIKEEYEHFQNNFFKSLREKSEQIERPYFDVVKVLIDKLDKQVYKSLLTSTAQPKVYEEDNFFKDEISDLNAQYPLLIKDLTAAISQYKEFPGLLERFKVLLDYTVPSENAYFLTTALIPIYTYKAIEEPDKMTADRLEKACVMSWVYRMLEVSQIIVDDIIDHSNTRYNKPVWYQKDGVSLELAVLDSHYLVTGAYLLLKKYLESCPCYVNIFELYNEKMFITFITQFMDVKNVGVEQFVKLIPLRFDKALYVFDGSVRSALYLANIRDRETHEIMKKFTIPMSRFFQLQNDFSGVFADEEKFQRFCPDIVSGRNSWLVAMALKIASPSQRKVIEENYGNGDPESGRKVMEIYRELKLDEVHQKRTEEFSQEMNEKFKSACETARKLSPPDTEVLELYSLYKQATVGNVNIAKPVDEEGRKRWEAWKAKKGVTVIRAKEQYVAKVKHLSVYYA